jgi:hypothetical protein
MKVIESEAVSMKYPSDSNVIVVFDTSLFSNFQKRAGTDKCQKALNYILTFDNAPSISVPTLCELIAGCKNIDAFREFKTCFADCRFELLVPPNFKNPLIDRAIDFGIKENELEELRVRALQLKKECTIEILFQISISYLYVMSIYLALQSELFRPSFYLFCHAIPNKSCIEEFKESLNIAYFSNAWERNKTKIFNDFIAYQSYRFFIASSKDQKTSFKAFLDLYRKFADTAELPKKFKETFEDCRKKGYLKDLKGQINFGSIQVFIESIIKLLCRNSTNMWSEIRRDAIAYAISHHSPFVGAKSLDFNDIVDIYNLSTGFKDNPYRVFYLTEENKWNNFLQEEKKNNDEYCEYCEENFDILRNLEELIG